MRNGTGDENAKKKSRIKRKIMIKKRMKSRMKIKSGSALAIRTKIEGRTMSYSFSFSCS
jgi:hypothetical protein